MAKSAKIWQNANFYHIKIFKYRLYSRVEVKKFPALSDAKKIKFLEIKS